MRDDYIIKLEYMIKKAKDDIIRAEERRLSLENALDEYQTMITVREHEEYKQFLEDNPEYVKPNDCTLKCKNSDFCEYDPFCRHFERWDN